MRVLGRLIRLFLLMVLVLVIGLASPIIYVETQCRGTAIPAPYTPLSGETRPENRTLLTYPEWHIVHAYDDYAEVIRQGDPHDFGYLKAIGGYWNALCTTMKESAGLGKIDGSTRQLVYVIGVSFTFEMLMKAAYEETAGRLTTWLRGPERTTLDELSAKQAATYADFLQQVPWYRYDFRADADVLNAAAGDNLRDRERALALGLEHRARAAYAGLIGQAVATSGQDDLTLQMIVENLTSQQLEAAAGVTVLRLIDAGIEVETPRYRALTGILDEWARAGADFVDIAGNDQIMFTALSDSPEIESALASLPRQGYGDTRHLFLVPVGELAEHLRALEATGLRLEHIHDY